MKSQVIKVVIAATITTALTGVAPASAFVRRQLPPQTAHDTEARQHYKYGARLYNQQPEQWDPWGHWGSYYGPMIH